jgi:hypothetical protein
VVIGIVCSFFQILDLPVFWPVLVVYWLILFALTSESMHAGSWINLLTMEIVRRQIQHMIKYRYVPFSFGKTRYGNKSSN